MGLKEPPASAVQWLGAALVRTDGGGRGTQEPTIFVPVFLSFFDSRLSLRDLPGFLALGFCGDLSGIGPPSVTTPYPGRVRNVSPPVVHGS